ncbi:hypothetical protein ACFQX6_50025 [Streptosporangium lutulentum]
MACRDGAGSPYEITLELHRDGALYGTVGERCGRFLTRLARGVAEARAATRRTGPIPTTASPTTKNCSPFVTGRGTRSSAGANSGAAADDPDLGPRAARS